MSALKELFGDEVYGAGDKKVPTASLSDNDLIGIYFSAHWCPPCRAFTPKLAECYKKINDSGKKFEVIFVSSDKDQASFNDYFAEMPWLTVGFGSNKKDELSSKYSVRGIPTLILVDKNGQTKYTDGRQKVAADPEGASYPW
nr:hypothetical protein BaRGS_009709 [Batillaria attramentaria]